MHTRLLLSGIFRESVSHLEKKSHQHVQAELRSLACQLNSRPDTSCDMIMKKTFFAEKYKSKKDIWKYRITDKSRVSFTYGNNIEGLKGNYSDSVVLLNYDENHEYNDSFKDPLDPRFNHLSFYLTQQENNTLEEHSLSDGWNLGYMPYFIVLNNLPELLGDCYSGCSVVPNTEQNKAIHGQLPLIISGCAGSGKTVVGLHILRDQLFSHLEKSYNTLYLTYTERLKEWALNAFQEIAPKYTENVSFQTIQDYCISTLGLNRTGYMNPDRFVIWYHKNIRNDDFDPLDVWTEIRGLIKGYDVDSDDEIPNKFWPLRENTYNNLNQGYYEANSREKQEIYNIYRLYEDYRRNSSLFDDNDLAQRMRKQAKKGDHFCNLLVVDEAQDLTEQQLGMLLEISKKNVVFTGDRNQIVNPTFFDTGRLQKMFYSSEEGNRLFNLDFNYRNGEPILRYANHLSSMRAKRIGKGKAEEEEEMRSVQGNPGSAWILKREDGSKAIQKIVNEINDCGDAALIVSSPEQKRKIEKYLTKTNSQRIYTVSEIKGLEKKLICCWNIMSDFKREWLQITRGEGRRSSRHRFLFNLLYVCTTRAKSCLCFYESEDFEGLGQEIHKYLDPISARKLIHYIRGQQDPQSLLEAARDEERSGQYSHAAAAYRRYEELSGENMQQNIKHCEAKMLEEMGIFEEAAHKYMEVSDFRAAARLYEELGKESKLAETLFLQIPDLKIQEEEKVMSKLREILRRKGTTHVMHDIMEDSQPSEKFLEGLQLYIYNVTENEIRAKTREYSGRRK